MIWTLEKISRIFPFTPTILACLFFLFITLSDFKSPIEAQVERRNSLFTDTIEKYHDASIIRKPSLIYIQNPTLTTQLLAPRSFFIDPVNSIMLIVYSILVALFFWDFSYDNPFTQRTLKGLKLTLVITFFFMIGDFWRNEWFNNENEFITSGQYYYNKRGVSFVIGVLAFVLLRLIWILKKGNELKVESDLTI